jgi:DtxR family Mn-dependent transcriptional regulator
MEYKMHDGLDLSPRKVEYLKYIFECGRSVKTNEIATRFKVDPSTVTKMIGELAESGLITHTPYYGVICSESGIEYTKFLIKRHRILSLMFARLGLSREQACIEVARFESFVSRETIERMCRAMGHPQQGICGEITHDSCNLEMGP